MFMQRLAGSVICLFLAATLGACSSNYITPESGVSLASITDDDIQEAFAREAISPFPAHLAMARIQGTSYGRPRHGYSQEGGFTVITTQEFEEADFQALGKLPMISGVAPLSRLLLPATTTSLQDLRQPAAQLKADLLLVYTIDSTFFVDDTPLGPLSLVSLGFIPNHKAHVTSTLSALLVDVRTGFIYGSAEATAKQEQRSSMWSTESAIEAARNRAETEALHQFVGEFQTFWKGVVEQHARKS